MAEDSKDLELTDAADLRELRRRLSRQDQYLSALQLAAALGSSARVPEDRQSALGDLVCHAKSRLEELNSRSGSKLHPRHRPRRRLKDDERGHCLVYLDECGSHVPKVRAGEFGAFVLAAAIVREVDLAPVEESIASWKESVWGRRDVILHEPELRKGTSKFWFNGDRGHRSDVLASLERTVAELPFTGIVVVVHRQDYAKLAGNDPLDDSLPLHVYHMALNFLCERITMCLDSDYGGAKGKLVAESRGPREDAELQYEFVRLHLEGTSYVSDSWFRYQLVPGIVFEQKARNLAGLQLADLMARPCAEKVLQPDSTPPRWEVFRDKLVQTQKTANSPLGLKVMPWHERYEGIWKPKS